MTHEALVPIGSPHWIVSRTNSSVELIKELVIGYTSWIAFLSGKH